MQLNVESESVNANARSLTKVAQWLHYNIGQWGVISMVVTLTLTLTLTLCMVRFIGLVLICGGMHGNEWQK